MRSPFEISSTDGFQASFDAIECKTVIFIYFFIFFLALKKTKKIGDNTLEGFSGAKMYTHKYTQYHV